MTVIGGHQRLKVLKELGYNEVECVVVDLNKNKEKALNIALNKISGDWDNSKLEELLAELKETNIDLDITGFSFDEVDNILKDITGSKEDDFDIQQALDEIDEPTTKTGDIWILGRHRLMCGDSTQKEQVLRLMNNQEADMLLTDPPYNVVYEGKTADALKIENDNIGSSKVEILYDFDIDVENVKLLENETHQLTLNIKTTPENYERIFNDEISYNSQNPEIATVDSNGVITGISKGSTAVEVTVGNKTKTINVEVTKSSFLFILIGLL